jgi:hypothetical protein
MIQQSQLTFRSCLLTPFSEVLDHGYPRRLGQSLWETRISFIMVVLARDPTYSLCVHR